MRSSRCILCGLILLAWWATGGDSKADGAARAAQEAARGISDALQRRGLEVQYKEFEEFIAGRLAASSGTNSFRDKTGNCRLAWVEALLKHPRESLGEAECFTRALQAAAGKERGALCALAALAEGKMTLAGLPETAAPAKRKGSTAAPAMAPLGGQPLVHGPAAVERNATFHEVLGALACIRMEWDRALTPLTSAERGELKTDLYFQSTGFEGAGHRFAEEQKGRRICDLLEKIDRAALWRAFRCIDPLTAPKVIQSLRGLGAGATQRLSGVKGEVLAWAELPAGRVILGGTNRNEYQLDELSNVCAVIDPGGDDVYLEGVVGRDHPVLVILDLAGNDAYRGSQPGIQGGAILGVSVLMDCSGNDRYEAGDVAQGSCLGGIGLLLDQAGDDTYHAAIRVQGHALGGIGLLLDRAGRDDFHAAFLAQGVGGPLGFGLLADRSDNDHYYAGGRSPSPYDDSPGFGGWSQGVGIGPRGVANGGIGILLDGGGDDVYEADYFSHGGGYWFAVGVARDFGGNDRRIGATRMAWDGTPRKPARFVRWGTGFGCHYALGFVIDDSGDDTYQGDFACNAYGWDLGVGVICDAAGNDRYEVPGSGLAQAFNGALAVLYDGNGDDCYLGPAPGTAGATVDYYPEEKGGRNFAFLIDRQGKDQYSAGITNKTEIQQGGAGGFVIDR